MSFWDSVGQLGTSTLAMFAVALIIAFAFEFINGFHDTANAVTTVIYTRSLPPTPAVVYSGFMNFLGVLVGGTAVAFGIVNLLPVELLVDSSSKLSLVMVLALLLAGVMWNLGTWYLGLPVSSSHTLIGSILGVGLANSLYASGNLDGVNWKEVKKVAMALLFSPMLGFLASAILLLLLKFLVRNPRLYSPPQGDDRPPGWIRGVLVATCGGVSFAHGSNDGQKGMGLILLVLIGFLPMHYALNTEKPAQAAEVYRAAGEVREAYAKAEMPMPKFKNNGKEYPLAADLDFVERELAGKTSFTEVPEKLGQRWEIREALFRIASSLKKDDIPAELKADPASGRPAKRETFNHAIEFVPLWVVIGVALALGIGTTVGYKRIVVTVAEKIGKSHLTYAQGAAAETVAATTILAAAVTGLPVSTTQVLSSGIAGTMAANGSGIQVPTVAKIALAWLITFPSTMLLSAVLFVIGKQFV
jgi:phosphate/sulfate permease